VIDSEVVARLLHFRSQEAPVLSAYAGIPPDPDEVRGFESRLHSLLKPVRELADSDALGHYPRESLRHDIDRVLALRERAREFVGHGIAVFTCEQEGLYEEVEFPRRVRDRVEVDETPYLRPLLAVLDESHRYCVAVVDREKAWLYEFYMGQLEDATKVRGRALRRPNYAGGWQGYKEHTVHDKAELLARRHFRETADKVDDVMGRSGAELLILGGHQETVAEFTPFLPHHLQPRVAGTFVIDPSTMSPGEVRERADDVVDAYERDEERRFVDEALERVAAGGFGAAGLAWCLMAANEHAIQLLLVHDDEQAPGRICDTCGWLGLEGQECPVDGQRTRTVPDVIDEMAALVVDTSGRVEHVYVDTPLSQHAVAALLRFPVADPASG
jgi:peptide subunit release factor 1 (eRF1)